MITMGVVNAWLWCSAHTTHSHGRQPAVRSLRQRRETTSADGRRGTHMVYMLPYLRAQAVNWLQGLPSTTHGTWPSRGTDGGLGMCLRRHLLRRMTTVAKTTPSTASSSTASLEEERRGGGAQEAGGEPQRGAHSTHNTRSTPAVHTARSQPWTRHQHASRRAHMAHGAWQRDTHNTGPWHTATGTYSDQNVVTGSRCDREDMAPSMVAVGSVEAAGEPGNGVRSGSAATVCQMHKWRSNKTTTPRQPLLAKPRRRVTWLIPVARLAAHTHACHLPSSQHRVTAR